MSPLAARHLTNLPTMDRTPEDDDTDLTSSEGGGRGSMAPASVPGTPFSYYFVPSVLDYALMALMVPLLPLRIGLAIFSLLLAWAVGRLSLHGLQPQIVNAAPFTGWRALCRQIILCCSRSLAFSAAIQRIEFVGEPGAAGEGVGHFVESSVAPVIICAPHFSYLDSFISGTVDITPVIKASAGKAPIFGRFLTALQPIFVNREKAESRQSTKEAIIRRCVAEKGLWPPVLIFPEGTTGNGKCLFKFKPGAFYPGQPIQITSIEYISCMSDWNPIVMAWDSCIPVWQSLAYIFLQPHITARIHVLPVYYPSEDEKENPILFAANVQKVVADYLEIHTTEHTYEHAREHLRSLVNRKRS